MLASRYTLLRLNTDWLPVFIDCLYYYPPFLLTLLDGRQVQNPSTHHHYQTTQGFLAFPSLWITYTHQYVNKMLLLLLVLPYTINCYSIHSLPCNTSTTHITSAYGLAIPLLAMFNKNQVLTHPHSTKILLTTAMH